MSARQPRIQSIQRYADDGGDLILGHVRIIAFKGALIRQCAAIAARIPFGSERVEPILGRKEIARCLPFL
jgi:hypothetical protein